MENRPAKAFVGRVTARDEDGHKLHFAINSSFPVPFDIDNYGFIRTNDSVDREKNSTFQFVVMVTDDGIKPRSASANVTVIIQDENDNPPKFTQEIYQVSFFINIVYTFISILIMFSNELIN